MKITDTIHAIRHPFRLAVAEGQYVDRFVYSYLLCGRKICLIDAGVAKTSLLIQDYMKKLGRSMEEISVVFLTHAHPDHIGGCAAIMRNSPASFAAHPADKPWIENIQDQYRERPGFNFFELVEASVPVAQELREGDVIHWDRGKTLKVFETPGHSAGSISFLFQEEDALFSGDAVPAVGTLPIYLDPEITIQSIQTLRKIPGLKYLFSSWHDPIFGNQIVTTMEEAIRYIERIDEILNELSGEMSSASTEELAIRTLEKLGIKVKKVPPIVLSSFQAHRK